MSCDAGARLSAASMPADGARKTTVGFTGNDNTNEPSFDVGDLLRDEVAGISPRVSGFASRSKE